MWHATQRESNITLTEGGGQTLPLPREWLQPEDWKVSLPTMDKALKKGPNIITNNCAMDEDDHISISKQIKEFDDQSKKELTRRQIHIAGKALAHDYHANSPMKNWTKQGPQ